MQSPAHARLAIRLPVLLASSFAPCSSFIQFGLDWITGLDVVRMLLSFIVPVLVSNTSYRFSSLAFVRDVFLGSSAPSPYDSRYSYDGRRQLRGCAPRGEAQPSRTLRTQPAQCQMPTSSPFSANRPENSCIGMQPCRPPPRSFPQPPRLRYVYHIHTVVSCPRISLAYLHVSIASRIPHLAYQYHRSCVDSYGTSPPLYHFAHRIGRSPRTCITLHHIPVFPARQGPFLPLIVLLARMHLPSHPLILFLDMALDVRIYRSGSPDFLHSSRAA